VAAKAEEAVEPVVIDEDEGVADGTDVYLVEALDLVVDCEPEGVVEDLVCEDGVAVVAEEDLDGDSMVLDFVREPME
jgi:hypothetical protein